MRRIPPDGATSIARKLRRDPTDAEKAMWKILRTGFPHLHFRRQVPLRHFFVDFASHRAKLVIEVDGRQHGGVEDIERDPMIAAEGYRILRFWNHDVLQNPEGFHSRIAELLGEIAPTQTLLHQGLGLQ